MNYPSEKRFYNYLDTFRFIAVSLVIFSHWLPSYFEHLKLSKIGVDMFFVLSGFLITENLLVQKSQIITKKKGIGAAFQTFYARRSLRIFPIYYLVVLIFFFLDAALLKEHILWYLFYGVNYLIIFQHHWPGMFSHLWSLSVEEQFYLLWPALVFLTPYKWITKTLIFLILISFIFVVLYSRVDSFTILSLPGCLSTLCMGALLACFKRNNNFLFRVTRFDLIIFFLFVVMVYVGIDRDIKSYWVQLFTALFSFYFIKLLITRENRGLDFFFANPITSFLGKISYGLYLYHNFIPWLLRNLNGTETETVIRGAGIFPEIKNGVVLFIIHWMLLLVVSIVSWFMIEKPINSLKTKFSY